MKIKIIDCDHPQYWYVDHIGEVFNVSEITRTDFITEPDGHLVLKRHAEVIEEDASAWSGEGRPPIGTVCEVGYRDSWVPATVLALDHNVIVVRYQLSDKSVGYSGFDINNVRPIKSQKQKEIDKIASELLESVNKNGQDFKHLEWEIAEHLYNAGLQFTKDSK